MTGHKPKMTGLLHMERVINESEAMRKSYRILTGIAAVVALIVTVGLSLGGCAKDFVYGPSKEMWTVPSKAGLAYEDVYLQASDGVKLNGWYVPADNAKLTVLFFHGNGGNISGCLSTAAFLKQQGANVFMLDYRGYGRSEGSPSEIGTYRDARAAWDWLVNTKHIRPDTIVIFGRSLGGSIATELAANVQPRGLWIESTFTSCADVGARKAPRWIINVICQYKYPTIENIKKVHCPVLVLHSPEDTILPYEFGQKLFAAANEPKTFVTISGGHNDGFDTSGEKYTVPVIKWLDGLSQGK
jgi:uncharacterized protein